MRVAKRWYVAGTEPNQELVAKANIDKNWRAEVPLTLRAVTAGGRRAKIFPSYVFVEFDIEDDLTWPEVNRTRGVTKLLPIYREAPLALPLGFMEGLLAAVYQGAFDAETREELLAGYSLNAPIKITSGPFEGMVGRFGGTRKGCLDVILGLLGGETMVRIPKHIAIAAVA
jgi:transcription antitermination factor NusG